MSKPPPAFAHSLPYNRDTATWEPLADHLSDVGKLAASFAASFGAETAGRAMGLLHDIGKTSAAYQAYIHRPPAEGGPKGPDHSTAGAREVFRLYPVVGRLMAFGIAGHHSGLMDGAGHEGQGTALLDRLDPKVKQIEDYDGWQAHVSGLPDDAELRAGLKTPAPNPIARGFEYAFFARMLFSCLVDADFLATEAFYAHAAGDAAPQRGGTIAQTHLDSIRSFMAQHRRDDTPVNALRSRILDHANARAKLPPGLFTLTVPTGGGKTLTSLSFALEHALEHDLRRVVYVIPYTSIIEQTAGVFRKVLGNDADVLEHHSSFDWDRTPPGSGNDVEGEGSAGLAKLRRDAENWDAPIVVTTAVQFFESLFARRTSRARKLHNLARSVIILDEAQSLPLHVLRPCLAAIDELARNYGATVVLCTATQPALRVQDRALPQTDAMQHKDEREGLNIPDERELAPDPQGLYAQLKRVAVEWQAEPVSDAQIIARFTHQPQMLCIVNSRAHARALFEGICTLPGARHLTTLMCARHRRDVLAQLREDLKSGRPVRLVATSLIEAGVDIDFPEVWRAATGLASIAQAAGRCNREGGLKDRLGRVVVFEPADAKIPRAIASFYEAAKPVLRRPGLDPLGLDANLQYHQELYFNRGYEKLDCGTLGDHVFPILPAIANSKQAAYPFSRISDAFRLIDDVMDPVIVPFDDEARRLLKALQGAPFPPAGIQRRLQQYTVPIPAAARAAMLATGAVQAIRSEDYGDRFVALAQGKAGELPALYDMALGLRLDDPTWRSSEDNMM